MSLVEVLTIGIATVFIRFAGWYDIHIQKVSTVEIPESRYLQRSFFYKKNKKLHRKTDGMLA